MEFGLNLFSIRNLIKTEEDFLKTACALKEMGYSYMQFSGVPHDADCIARVSKASDMPVVLTHMNMTQVIEATDKLMDDHAKFNCFNIGIGALTPFDLVKDEAGFKKAVEDLNKAAEKMKNNGFKFFYHHHQFEFLKRNGQTAFDYMIANAPYINFTADTYWLQYGGVDVNETLKKLNGRIECTHLKDYKIVHDAEKNTFNPTFAPVGDGTMDFAVLVETMRKSGTKYFLVEQDNAAELPDTLEQVRRSANYLKTL